MIILFYIHPLGTILNLRVHSRDCRGCTVKKFQCESKYDVSPTTTTSNKQWNNGNITFFEYFPIEYVMDNEITTLRNNWDHSCLDKPNYKTLCKQSVTTQEFIFGEYFSSDPMTSPSSTCPDLILHLGTNVHDMGRRTSKLYQIAIRWMFSIIQEFLDDICPNTTYYWSTASKINEALVPEKFKNNSVDSRVIEFNDIAIKILLSFHHERMLLGFDQYNYSMNLRPSKYKDAVHFNGPSYIEMAKRMLLYLGLSNM